MPTVACVIKTPAVSKTQFPEVAPVRLSVPMIGKSEARMLLHVAYRDPCNHDVDDLVAASIYSYGGRLHLLIDAIDLLTPLARGEATDSGLAFTIDREMAVAGNYATGIRGAVQFAERTLAEAVFISTEVALRPMIGIPYLLISQKMHNILGRPYHEFMLSVETSTSSVSVDGVQCARWPVWEYDNALVDVTGRMIELESLMSSSEWTVQGEVAMFNLVSHSGLMFNSGDLPALQSAFSLLPALPGFDTPEYRDRLYS